MTHWQLFVCILVARNFFRAILAKEKMTNAQKEQMLESAGIPKKFVGMAILIFSIIMYAMYWLASGYTLPYINSILDKLISGE